MSEPVLSDRPWSVTLEVLPGCRQRLRVTEGDEDLLVSEFSGYPDHPRALLFLLEGLALWKGTPLLVVIRAERPVNHSLGLGGFGGDDWPEESALVRFLFVEQAKRRLRLRRPRGRDAS